MLLSSIRKIKINEMLGTGSICTVPTIPEAKKSGSIHGGYKTKSSIDPKSAADFAKTGGGKWEAAGPQGPSPILPSWGKKKK